MKSSFKMSTDPKVTLRGMILEAPPTASLPTLEFIESLDNPGPFLWWSEFVLPKIPATSGIGAIMDHLLSFDSIEDAFQGLESLNAA